MYSWATVLHTLCMTVHVYLCRWTSWTVWWAAVCRPYHQARHSVQCRAPCSRSSPSLTATACGSRSAEGWHPEPCQPGGEPEEKEKTLQLWWQEAQQSQHFNLRVLHFRLDELNSSTRKKGESLSKYCQSDKYVTGETNAMGGFGVFISKMLKTLPINSKGLLQVCLNKIFLRFLESCRVSVCVSFLASAHGQLLHIHKLLGYYSMICSPSMVYCSAFHHVTMATHVGSLSSVLWWCDGSVCLCLQLGCCFHSTFRFVTSDV